VGSLRPNLLAYTASKVAVETMVKILAKELKGTCITANCVVPGPIATEIFFTGKTEEMINKAIDRFRMGRSARPGMSPLLSGSWPPMPLNGLMGG